MNVRGDGHVSGEFVIVEPPHRIVFTWGWEGDPQVPAGSSRVEVVLEAEGDGSTRLTLTHSGLPLPAVELHQAGWHHYLARLTVRAAGGDPGRHSTVTG